MLLIPFYPRMSAISKIEYMYWPGPVLIPHSDTHVDNLRQVSQITYYGPFGKQQIYIDYDEECDDIYIRADIAYSVDAGKVINIRDKDEDVFLFDITVGEILQHLIGNFDVCVTWAENGLPDSVLNERVFQAPLSKIDVYVPSMPSTHYMHYMPCIPEENDFMDGYEDGFDNAIEMHNSNLDKAFDYGFEQGYNDGVSAGKYAKDCDCESPDYCAICADKLQNEIDRAFAYFEIRYGNPDDYDDNGYDSHDDKSDLFFPDFDRCCINCDRKRESGYNSYDECDFY